MTIAKSLMLGTAAAMIAFQPAFADASTDVLNGQCNLGDVWSQIKVETDKDDISATATSIGNNFSADLQYEAGWVTSNQKNTGDIGSEVKATISNPVGNVSVASTSIGNNVVATNYDNYMDSYSSQENTGGVNAKTSVSVANAGGHGVSASSVAAGNSYTAGHQWGYGDTQSYSSQINSGDVSAQTYVNVNNAGNISATATAIGNNAIVTNLNQ